MNPRCRTQLNQARVAAGGKELTDAQAAKIESRIKLAAKFLATQDPPAWRSMSSDQRTLMAAQQAAEDIRADAANKVRQAELQALKKAEFVARTDRQMADLGFSRAQAVAADYQITDDMVTGLTGEYFSHLGQALDAAGSTKGAGLARSLAIRLLSTENPKMTLDLSREIHAKGNAGTGNTDAVAGAKQWLELAEEMRLRRNAAGGNTGRLEDGYMPTMWEPDLVLKAGPDKFAADILPELNRAYYVREDGSRMSDAEVLDFLRPAAETIASDGANKMEPGRPSGTGARANRGSEHRQIHFKDGEAYVRVMAKYGTGSMYDAMTAHVSMMARDIVLLERYGANPQAQHKLMRDEIVKADKSGLPTMVTFSDLDSHWAQIAGTQVSRWRISLPAAIGGDITGAGVARKFAHARNVETVGKLQGAVISSITDVPMYFAAVHMNKLPVLQAIANIPRAFASNTPGLRAIQRRNVTEYMNTMGMASDTIMRSLNRFTAENASASWSGRTAAATMRVSLMNWWTDSLRNAFSLTMQQSVARSLDNRWDDLDEYLRINILGRHGITEDVWTVMQSAQRVQTEWGPLLTPEAIYATGDPRAAEVATAYLGFLRNRQETAIMNPDVAARAFWKRATETGSAGGEIARSLAQFQMFPTSMFTRFYREVLQTPTGLDGAPLGFGDVPYARLAFIGSTIAAMTFFGALAFQAKQVVAGKDPVDMTTAKFWARAFAQGGGLGYFSGLLMDDSSEARSTSDPLYRMLGPLAGSTADAFELTVGNTHEYLAGKDTHAGAEAIRFVRSHAPLVNLWYAKTAIDHAGLHAAQEAMSPGYLSRIKNKQRKDWGGEYWWPPGASFDEMRAPDLEAVAGD